MQRGLAGSRGSGFPAWPPDAGPQRANTAPRTGFIELWVCVLVVTLMGHGAPLVGRGMVLQQKTVPGPQLVKNLSKSPS